MIPYISADRERAAAAMPEACGPGRRRRGRDMPARTERYRFVRWEIEDVNGVARTLPGGYADVTRGGGLIPGLESSDLWLTARSRTRPKRSSGQDFPCPV
jgi:hypothetical protein